MPQSLSGFPIVVLSKIGGIELDAVLNELHHYDAEISENPVENGTIFSDNVVLQPIVLEMTGRISDAAGSLLSLRLPGRSVDAFKSLVALQQSREPFEVVTGINVYKNMMFQSLTVPRDRTDGNSIRFTAILREILVVGDEAETNRERIAGNVRHSALAVSAKGVIPKVLVI